jgi:type IV pilus assembly protein PilC
MFIVTPGQLNRRAQLYSQLGSMISAGVPLMKALEMAANNRAMRASRKTILALIENLQTGHTFSESMARVQTWMPDFDIALLSVGEKTGRLDVNFRLLGQYYTTRVQIIRDTINGLLITILTLNVFLLIFPVGLLVQFVVTGIFNNNYSECIPFIIQKVLTFGALYGIILFLIFACQGKRGLIWRSIIESIFQGIPILRLAQKYLVISRLSAALEALTNAGVSIIQSWEYAAAASGSPHLIRAISKWQPQIESGQTPAELVNQTAYFPEMFCNLYHTGEISGQLDDTLARLQKFYQEEGFQKMKTFTFVLNWGIYFIIAGLVAFNIIHFYVGYFNAALNTN